MPKNNDSLSRALRNSTIEGALALTMVALTTGAFITGYALELGADNFFIGLLAALPTLASPAQLASSYILERGLSRKPLSVWTSFFSRVFWIPIILLPLLFSYPWTLKLSALLIGFSSLMASLSMPAWLSWMQSLVPLSLRGKYFGNRNAVIGTMTMVATLAGGYFLDHWKLYFGQKDLMGFLVVFGVAALLGQISLWILHKVPDWERPRLTREKTAALGPGSPAKTFGRDLLLPLKDPNFRSFTLFITAWNFAANIAVPFFTVYMLEDLRLSYSLISFFWVLITITNLLSVPWWGRLSDRFGNQPLIYLAALVAATFPLFYLFTTPGKYFIILLTVNLLAGVFWGGVILCSFNLMLKLAPREKASIYVAVHSTITGLVTAAAPLIGGALSKSFAPLTLKWGFLNLHGLHFLFLLSSVLRLLALPLLWPLKEPRAKSWGGILAELMAEIKGVSSKEL